MEISWSVTFSECMSSVTVDTELRIEEKETVSRFLSSSEKGEGGEGGEEEELLLPMLLISFL